ncbi:hypothetical protein BJ546DRAFT_973582 [Cryomyces antarcticus]
MPVSTSPSEADIVFNRANVALARSQRLIASWLPPRTAEELAHSKTEEELEKEDRETFAPVPELLGLGAKPPKDIVEGSFRRTKISSNDAVLKQLLGKRAGSARQVSTSLHAGAKPLTAKPVTREEESEEEEGRASLFTSKRSKKRIVATPEREVEVEEPTSNPKIAKPPADDSSDVEAGEATQKASTGGRDRSPKKGGAGNYLDELLADRSRKKKKKKYRKDGSE